MNIDFESMQKKIIPSFKGGEKAFDVKMFDDGQCKIMQGKLCAGASVGLHEHIGSAEIVYVLSGNGKVIYDDGEEILKEGSCHYCPEGHSHSLINCGTADLIFFAVVPNIAI